MSIKEVKLDSYEGLDTIVKDKVTISEFASRMVLEIGKERAELLPDDVRRAWDAVKRWSWD